jgi:mRNA-degrading endonuclease toxin of MazEF toxin-antitoxin module
VTGIIRTITQDMIDRKLGTLPGAELIAVENQLRTTLEL